jgi:hypothetical protein
MKKEEELLKSKRDRKAKRFMVIVQEWRERIEMVPKLNMYDRHWSL